MQFYQAKNIGSFQVFNQQCKHRTEQNRNFINLYYICTSLYNTQQTTYKYKVTLYTLTINTQYIYIYKQYILI